MEMHEHMKKELGESYEFDVAIAPKDVKIILENNNPIYSDEVVFSLLVGCVGIEATILDRCVSRDEPPETDSKVIELANLNKIPTDLFIRYDVIIRAKQASGRWCSYESLDTVVDLDSEDIEQTMFDILFNFAQSQGLSFTELNDIDNPRIRLIKKKK